MTTIQSYIDKRREVVTELRAEIDRRTTALAKASPHMRDYAQKEIDQLEAAAQQYDSEITNAEQSFAYRQEQEFAASFEQRRQERALQQRRQERFDRISAEQEAYSKRVNTIEWRLVSVPQQEERNEIVRAHLAELDRRNAANAEIERVLNPEAQEVLEAVALQSGVTSDAVRAALEKKHITTQFETYTKSPITGKGYVVITDTHGTYVDHSISGATAGDSTE